MKVHIQDHNQILGDIRKEFEVVEKLDEADVLFIWNDVLSVERSIIDYAKKRKIKTYVFEHGRRGSSKYYPPFNEEIYADTMFVWGELDKERLIEAGRKKKKIKVVGTTVFSHLKGRKEHEGINVVFCPEHWDKPVIENQQVRKELNKLKGVNIVTKLIDMHDPSLFDNPIISDRRSPDHLDICADVLSTADLVVGVAEGTFELMAQALDIPVVTMEEWSPKAFGGDEKYEVYTRHISPASKRATMDNLLEVIQSQLDNPDELKEERKKAVEDEGGMSLDTIKLIKEQL